MRPPTSFVRIVDRKRYSVVKSLLLAGDDYWDGHNFERSGRNTWLYRTSGGRFFTFTRTQWQGEPDSLNPLSQDEAIALFEGRLSEHQVGYAEAFPGVEVADA